MMKVYPNMIRFFTWIWSMLDVTEYDLKPEIGRQNVQIKLTLSSQIDKTPEQLKCR